MERVCRERGVRVGAALEVSTRRCNLPTRRCGEIGRGCLMLWRCGEFEGVGGGLVQRHVRGDVCVSSRALMV